MKDNKERKKLIKNVLDRGKCKDNNKNKPSCQPECTAIGEKVQINFFGGES